jgi:hypothetical protein
MSRAEALGHEYAARQLQRDVRRHEGILIHEW